MAKVFCLSDEKRHPSCVVPPGWKKEGRLQLSGRESVPEIKDIREANERRREILNEASSRQSLVRSYPPVKKMAFLTQKTQRPAKFEMSFKFQSLRPSRIPLAPATE